MHSKVYSFTVFLFLCGMLCSPKTVWGQEKYWLIAGEEHSCPSQHVGAYLKEKGVAVDHASKWLCAFSVRLTDDQLEDAKSNTLFTEVRPVETLIVEREDDQEAPTAGQFIQALGPDVFRREGLDGSGVIIGVIDAGFDQADSTRMFEEIFASGRVLGTYDFITEKRSSFFDDSTAGDYHGRKVWGFLAGYDREKNIQEGLATGASFYLARTENGEKEHRIEEDDWVLAMEWMHKKGVRLVNTSLGYSEFDNPDENYIRSDMNGRTAVISRAAEKAVKEKGMTLVVSAGNMGRTKWEVITAPADVEGVISVGATNLDHWTKANYSSIGVEFVDFVKPNIASPSSRGTSYSSPAICGFVACLLQEDSTLTNLEVKGVLEKSGHLYPFGNNWVGYGVPRAERALALVRGTADTLDNRYEFHANIKKKKTFVELWDDPGEDIVLFHKKNDFVCVDQSVIRYNPVTRIRRKDCYKKRLGKPTVRLYRKRDVTRTTIVAGDEVVEVIWE